MKTFLACLQAFAIFFPCSLHASPFQNGNFETRTVSEPDLLPLGDKTLAGWEIGGTQSNIRWAPWLDDSLNHLIRFQPIASGATQWIQQTFDTAPGLDYRVAFAANGYNNGDLAGVRVEVLDSNGDIIISKAFLDAGILGIVWARGGVLYFTARSNSSTLRFTHLPLDSSNPTMEIDNVSVEPRAPKSQITAYPAIKIEGFVHTGYRVEYAETTAPIVWKTLADVWVNDVPPIVIDTNAPSVGSRIYRVIELSPE